MSFDGSAPLSVVVALDVGAAPEAGAADMMGGMRANLGRSCRVPSSGDVDGERVVGVLKELVLRRKSSLVTNPDLACASESEEASQHGPCEMSPPCPWAVRRR